MAMRITATGLVLLAGIAVLGPQAAVQAAEPQNVQKIHPRELVLRIKNASVEDLKRRSFLELNLLKNAVYASKGYAFAGDRPWLNWVFCEKRHRAIKRSGIAVGRSAPETRVSRLSGQAIWDLDAYDFPACKEGDALDADQIKSLANIRVALFKKIELLGTIRAIDDALDTEVNGLQREGEFAWILGKTVPLCGVDFCLQDSIRRELHGYNRLLQLIKNVERFDAMELLGLYTGDILFIRSVIEAKYGKPHDGTLSWEIGQIVGVTERKTSYDPKKLPVGVQAVLQMLDEVIQKILQSDLNDIPAALKGNSIEFLDSYNGGAC